VERTVRFGPGGRLFGVLASPASPNDEEAPSTVILLNTGVEPHIGPNRLYVPLSRALADRGHVVLRFDLGGIGDSVSPGAEENVAYPAHMLDDAREAIGLVRREAPGRRVILAGLCSGGWLAFQAAREGLALDAIISVNPPLYLLEGAVGKQWMRVGREWARYQRSMRDPAKWLKALCGNASYATFTRVAANAVARTVAVRLGGVHRNEPSKTLAHDLSTIAGRRVASLFVFSGGDDGLRYFTLHAERALRRAQVRDYIQQVVVDGAGHSFSPRASQETLRDLVIDFASAHA
jgi:alpha/beta superfamily hydrolase